MPRGIPASGSADRRFGDMPLVAMGDLQRRINDGLVEYLHPEKAHSGATIGGSMASLLRTPKVAEVVGRLVAVTFDQLSVPSAVTEVVILATATHWRCAFILYMHRRRAVASGVHESAVDSILAGADEGLSGELADARNFAERLLQHGDVTDDLFLRVADRWGYQGAVELISTVGFYTMLCLVLNVDRYPVPG